MIPTLLDSLPYILLALLFVVANGFFVAAEFSLVRVRLSRIKELINNGNRLAKHTKLALDRLDDSLSTVQVGITLASLGLGWITEKAFQPILIEITSWFGLKLQISASISATIAIFIALSISTFLHVVVGELMPKTMAIQYAEKMSLYCGIPMRFCNWAFYPLVWILNGCSQKLLKLFGMELKDVHSHAITEEELHMVLHDSVKAGEFTESEKEMLGRVMKFHDKTVREIMVPRPDVVAVDIRADMDEILEQIKTYTRLPVYDGDLDNIKGILYAKDLVYALREPNLIKLVDLLHDVQIVPETQNISQLLQQFQRTRVHMAIVVDEFGATAGLVTLEDAIEEIVGEIQDEYDNETAEVQRIADNAYLCEGKATIDKLEEVFEDFEPPEGDFETIGGLVLHLAGRVPSAGETFRHERFSFRVASREGRRLRKIAVRRVPTGSTQKVKPVGQKPHSDFPKIPDIEKEETKSTEKTLAEN